jgi:phenylacetate-CoA ligase
MTSAYGYKLYRDRYIGNHDKYLKQLLESQWYREEDLHDLVENKLIDIVRHAIKNVPFYMDFGKKEKITERDIQRISDLDKLPIISKEQIRENPEYFLANAFHRRNLIIINTSGTTGKTLKIYVDKDSRRHAYAFFTRLKMWAGINGKSPNVTFAGRTIVPTDAKHPPFWRRNAVMNNYLFSSYHLSQGNLKYYVDMLRRIQPYFIDSYPSSLYIVARYMKENSLSGIFPKAIITSAETLLNYQRETIEEVFQCPIYDQYGCTEQAVFVSQCERGTYHIHPEYGIVEFLRSDGTKAETGEPARLICTGFTNRAMPFIRYDIGDVGIASDKKCSCGRAFPVIEKIVGRIDDIIMTKDGRQVGRLDPVFKGLQSIKEAQIVQEDYDKIIVKVVPGKSYREEDGLVVVNELKKRLGSHVNVEIQIVDEIPRSAGAKFRAVISNVRK